MNKKELVNAVAETPGITGAQAEKIIQSFMASITTALSKGEKVTLMGFGSLQTVKTKTRMYRDINSGESKKARGKTIEISNRFSLIRKHKKSGVFRLIKS
jgi:DNA-binding protein HU-beta